ncbi:MAG: roadblock/LC7 domain-containing protein [Candidatus Eiseniibacteriota bacterium]
MPQWTLFENDFQAIDRVLERLLEKTNALSVHLIDRSGQLITTSGRTADFDATAFASLIAADFTANAEVSQLLGEASIEAVVNEGRSRSVYSCLLAGRVIMCTVFDRRSTLGLVRLRAGRAARELDGVFKRLFEKVGLVEAGRGTSDFAAAAGREVDALFGD